MEASVSSHAQPPRPTSREDFRELIGQEFVGDWLRVTADRHRDFWRATYLERAYGESVGDDYPEGMLEGLHLLGLLDYLVADQVGTWFGFNYGFDRVRFTSTVTVHDRVRVRFHVTDVTSRENGELVRYAVTMDVEGRDRPGLVADWLVLLQPRPVAQQGS
jgi:acyl dehydratase